MPGNLLPLKIWISTKALNFRTFSFIYLFQFITKLQTKHLIYEFSHFAKDMHFSVTIKLLFVLSALLGAVFVDRAQCFQFDFSPNFTDSDFRKIQLDGSNFAYGAIQVTPDVRGFPITDKAGRAFFHRRFKLWNEEAITASFSTTFVLNIQNQTTHGGEGLAFILTGKPEVPASSHGQWLGIVNQQTNGSSDAQIVAIEFDTRKSNDQDLDSNHVSLNINSINSRLQFSLTPLGIDIGNGTDLKVVVRFDGQTKNLSVFLNDLEDPLFTEFIDLAAYLPQKVFVGFSASTSNETQLNCVKSWDFEGDEIDDNELHKWIRVAIPVLAVVLATGVGFLIWWKRKIDRENMEDNIKSIEEAIQGSSTAPRKFKWNELKKATGNFSPRNKLGKGGFGTVFKGVIGNREVAVKKFSEKSTQGKTEFIAEVTTIGNLRHRNLVKLIGWCYERRQFLLVYEYLANRSLDRYIFLDENSPENSPASTLGWATRRAAVVAAAQALDYLHYGCEDTVLHRDIKSSNIMLDSDFSAKLGDFGLARTMKLSDQTHHSTKEIAGTPGYMAPESILTGRFTVETDVYAFGVLILEVACGRRPGSQNQQDNYNCNIVNWVWEFHRKGGITEAADRKLKGDFEEFDMECVLVLGLACCHPNPNKRPSTKTVLQVLKGEVPPPEVPTERPVFMWPPLPPSFKELDISLGQITPFSELSGR